MSKSAKTAQKNNGYVAPPCPPFGYSFVAAASLFRAFGGLTVYVKYKSADKNKITVKDQTNFYVWYICPDREIVIVRNGYETSAFYPSGDSFDEVYDFNIFNDSVSRNLGLEYIMTNYAHSGNTVNPRIASRIPQDERFHVLSDSGGLQVARDAATAINPKDLIAFYNNNVDAGMVLDLPISVSSMDLIKRGAHIQKRNTEIMLAESKGVELLNIFHGHTLEQRRAYRKIVEDKRITRCAIGGMYRHSLLTGINIVYDLVETGMRYKQYHALGIFGSLHIPALVKAANSGTKPHITSDSTSHIQSAANKAYHFQFDIFHTSKRLPIGSRGSTLNTNKILPCQCGVCRVLKYTDLFAFSSNRFSLELLALHNAIEMARYTAQLQEAAQSLPKKEYNAIVYAQLKSHPQLKQVQQAMDFMDMADAHGLEAARKKYANFLDVNTARGTNNITGSLFQGPEEKGNADTMKAKRKRVESTMDEMEAVLKSIGG